MRKRYQISLIAITLLLVCSMLLASSYALWSVNEVQEDTNIIASGCFDATLNESGGIQLENTYPMSDTEGLKTQLYTFTIKNTCTVTSAYQVNLESLATTTLDAQYVKVSFDNGNPTLLSSYEDAAVVITSSLSSKKLTEGTLRPEASVTYSLRVWMDEAATNEQANKVFESKIVITLGATKESHTLSDVVQVGNHITMTPTAASYTIPTSTTGYTSDQTINPNELNLWRVIKKNDDGTVDVVSEYVSSTNVYFKGQVGYLNLVEGLNEIAAQYTNANYVQSTRHMGYRDQTLTCTVLEACPTDTGYETDKTLVENVYGTLVGKTQSGTATLYWLASRYVDTSSNNPRYSGRYVEEGGSLMDYGLYYSTGSANSIDLAIRPILTLKADVEIASGDGTTSLPYELN